MLALAHPQTQPHATPMTHDQLREREREREWEREREREKERERLRTARAKAAPPPPAYRTVSLPQKRLPPVLQQLSPKPIQPLNTPPASPPPRPAVDINSIPSIDLLKLLASLLQRIATANDALRTPASPTLPAPSRSPKSPLSAELSPQDPPLWRNLTTASREALAESACSLSFHARNIPQISLESYLLRILKYCPTTNQVFISLLVYFDRMSKLANDIDAIRGGPAEGARPGFTIDSYNVHRLVIAGVTVASKFFSDVFYTNSRYAKVGGLPQAELNQLELAFLLLNDFQLVVLPEELQQYTEQLVAYGADSQGPTPSLPIVDPTPELSREPEPEPEPEPAPSVPIPSSSESEAEDDPSAETDDENTIRPTHSTTCSETQSIYSEAPSYDSETQSIYSAVGSEPPYTPSESSFYHSSSASRQGSFADDEGEDDYDTYDDYINRRP